MICGVLLLSGCLSRKRVVPQELRPLPAETRTRTELIQDLEARSLAIQTLNGTVTLDASSETANTGVLTQYHQTKGYVLVSRPNQIRIKAVAPLALATVFDMVSDGHEFRVSVPLKNKFIVGDTNAPGRSDNPILNYRPQYILEALFVDIQPYMKDPQMRAVLEETISGRISYYVFSFINVANAAPGDARIVEKIWIDRTKDCTVARKQIFHDDGRVETDVEFSDYRTIDEVSFPQVITVHRPIDENTLKITFQETVLNKDLPANAFKLEAPSGADFVAVGDQAAKP